MDSMARRWVRWMGKIGMKDVTLPLSIAIAVFIRWAIGLGGYSGALLDHISASALRGVYFATLIRRTRHATNVWRLRGATPLDGDYTAPSDARMVFLRLGVLGP